MTSRNRFAPLFIALCIAFAPVIAIRAADPAPAKAEEKQGSTFLRFVDDGRGGGTLQTCIQNYEKDGVKVALIGAVHIAEKSYFDTLNKRFDTYDAVLYEMVKPKDLDVRERFQQIKDMKEGKPVTKPVLAEKPAAAPATKPAVAAAPAKPAEKPNALLKYAGMFQMYMKNTLKLSFQMEEVDYSKANFVHADMFAEDFAKMQSDRGENMITMMLQSLLGEMQKKAANPNAAPDPNQQINYMQLVQAFLTGTQAHEFKLILGRSFDKMEDSMAGLTNNGKGSVIVNERNKICLDVLDKTVKEGKSKNIAIFYGAAHLKDMEKTMMESGWKRTNTEWLVAWNMTDGPVEGVVQPAPAAPANPAAAPKK